MKLPDDVRGILRRKFTSKHREWLKDSQASFPVEINLNVPTEQEALRQQEAARAWIAAWRAWQDSMSGRSGGEIIWRECHWHSIGTQTVPEKLLLNNAIDVTSWIDEKENWSRAVTRFKELVQRWPVLSDVLPKYYNILAYYDEADFTRLTEMVSWICDNSNSNLYIRQIPVKGIDSKWLETRKTIVSELVAAIQSNNERDFFKVCGLKPLPHLIHIRILDSKLRKTFGDIGNISVPWEELAKLEIKPKYTFIVENLQTGLAFEDLPDTVVIMGLGYNLEVLDKISWLISTRCIYWGDIDTHGFAILNRARAYLSSLETVLMDEATLLSHKELWVEEKKQHASDKLLLLTDTEQELYQSLKNNTWGQQIRLEQERVRWDAAWKIIKEKFYS